MEEINSVYFCPRCGEDSKFVLSPNGLNEYKKTQETNKYVCSKCGLYYKIDCSDKDFD